jgi:hypothetical protein
VPDPKPRTNDLATYDPLNNAIWIPKSDFEKSAHSEEFKRTIVHELVHAIQYQSELKATKDPDHRKQLIEQKALNMTETEYVAIRWKHELQAEKIAWLVFYESLSQFDKSRGGTGFSIEAIKQVTETRTTEYMKQNKEAYELQFKQSYQKFVEKKTPVVP